jgi:hypothetical protein
MQTVKKWAAKIFPDENIDEADQNILLQTIRVPKNLMFLTDKLPKPIYEDDDKKRNTSDFAKIGKIEAKMQSLKAKRMNKIEEADEEKERDKKAKKRIIQKIAVDDTLPDILQLQKESSATPVNIDLSYNPRKIKHKKQYQPKNISMDHIKEKNSDLLINIKSISPNIANILLRK